MSRWRPSRRWSSCTSRPSTARWSNIPRDRVRLHVCWGNSEGPHHYDVPLQDILPIIYRANVGALVMEMANPRHAHEYKVYRDLPLPDDMLLVAGVIDTKTNYVEHPEVVADRLRLGGAGRRGRPDPRDGRHRLRIRHLRRLQPGSTRAWSGSSCAQCGRAPTSPAGSCSRGRLPFPPLAWVCQLPYLLLDCLDNPVVGGYLLLQCQEGDGVVELWSQLQVQFTRVRLDWFDPIFFAPSQIFVDGNLEFTLKPLHI